MVRNVAGGGGAAVRRRKTVTNPSYHGGGLKGNKKGARKSVHAKRRITTSFSLLIIVGAICLFVEFLEWKPAEGTIQVRGTQGAISNQIDNLKRVIKEKKGNKFSSPQFDDDEEEVTLDLGDQEEEQPQGAAQGEGTQGRVMEERVAATTIETADIPVEEDETPPDVEDEPEAIDLQQQREENEAAAREEAGRKIKEEEEEVARNMQVALERERKQLEETVKLQAAQAEAAKVQELEPPKISEEERARVQANEDEPFQDQKSVVIPVAKFPTLKYGTAWKKDKTAELVRAAIHAGFRHIDTANQPKHYNEAGVGAGWKDAAADLGLQRSDIWIQTKFSNLEGQDPENVPFDKNASLEDQVRQSVQNSLQNLQTDYLDSLVMHGPESSWDGNFKVWRVFEELVNAGTVKQIGVSNIWDSDFITYLYSKATIKPAVVQQRFYKDTNFEVKTREFCAAHNIEFQSFWTLGANKQALENEHVRNLAQAKGLTPETLLYAFCLTIGISPLDGTTNDQHMREDIAVLQRFNSAENKIFTDEKELTFMAETLGIQQWVSPKL